MDKRLEKSVTYLKGVGPKKAELFAKLGIVNVYDLLQFCPRDYIDLTKPCEIRAAAGEEPLVLRARLVQKLPPARVRKGMTICKGIFTDDSDDITVVLYNQEYLFDSLREGDEYYLYGRVSGNMVRKEMSAPQIFAADSDSLILPVYPLTEGLTQKLIRRTVKNALALIADPVFEIMPQKVRDKSGTWTLYEAWENVHFPKSMYSAYEARRRLIFDELFVHCFAVIYRRYQENRTNNYRMKPQDMSCFTDSLPFFLTLAQYDVLDECTEAMCSLCRMNRLIQGDVGSGKTVVAVGAAWFVAKNGYQSCVMAPTEILAAQHYKTFKSMLEPHGMRVALLTGSLTPKNKKLMQEAIAAGEYDVVVGTHALFSEKTSFADLALVITDEQHRFGVGQRAALSSKGKDPHRIAMSATPIPRTMALIFYGELDISVIDEMPSGRIPVKTYAVTGKLRERAYGFARAQLEEGRQCYVVCPTIDESESGLLDVTSFSKELEEGSFSGYRIGLLHGRMTAAEKSEVMQGFERGEIDVLVATTVVEVGVDVPNAAVMMIENADRFGLSQLHQLRGRVGRGKHQSYCILITDNKSEECIKRMKIITSTNDGFKIAEEDLKLRGPGDYFGTNQHGMPNFKIADLARDAVLFKQAWELSDEMVGEDRELKKPENSVLRELVAKLMDRGAEYN